jgi:hypothetical protein
VFSHCSFIPSGRAVLRMVALLAILLLCAACGSSKPLSVAQVATSQQSGITIIARDNRFEMPATFPGGTVEVTLNNLGRLVHGAQLVRIHNNVSQNQVLSALRKGEHAIFPLVTFEGGPGPVFAGHSQVVRLNLPSGNYLALSLVRDGDTMVQAARGMYRFFTVSGSPTPTPAPGMPRTNGQVALIDSAIRLPNTIRSGPIVLRVRNFGKQPHELTLLSLKPGKTEHHAIAFLQHPQGPAPFTYMGGMAALAPGLTGLLNLNLPRGNYVALCTLPDAKGGRPLYSMGMLTPFTVR